MKKQNYSINEIIAEIPFREPNGLNYKKNNIIIFGCDFAEGLGLSDEQTFAAKLSEFTKRPVYNRAVGGGGIQHAIMQIQTYSLDKVVKNSDYAIFVLSSINDNTILYCYHGSFFDKYFLLSKFIYPRYVFLILIC